ncbi:ribonuclease D [Thiohalophilus sp.]|uniref:ribonuclease D n=1 Tax=Thiohalophilus sp. TaxID=3028392 RepID=UPI003975DD7A
MSNYQYIETIPQLEAACEILRLNPVLALDTEFMREKTYYARLCLIQIASEDQVYILDPLRLEHLQPLFELLYDPGILIVLHAGRQDLELFYDLTGRIPAPVFDTQIAATLLGFADQIGYGALVEKVLGVQLDKSHARTDWAQRPLSDKQLTYAADDVVYLMQLYPEIHRRLQKLGREAWLTEDFAALSQPELYQNDPAQSWQRVSGHGRLKPRQLAALQGLAMWREKRAQQLDKPRKWILSDDVLLNLAQRLPDKKDKLAAIRGLPETVVREHSDPLLAAIQQARAMPESELPQTRDRFIPDHDQELVIDSLLLYLKYLAFNSQISPATLANRKEIERLVRGERELAILKGWREHIAGQALLDMLEGKTVIRIDNGQLKIQSAS